MRGIWRCSSCVAVLIAATWSTGVRAEPAPTQTIAGGVPPMAEKLAKAQVTQFPLHPHKRDDSCPASHNLCPASLSGGCCQNGYSCGTDSCYLTTMETTVSACGKVGYFACPISLNGGCCPVGYICGSNECTAPAGLTSVNTACPNNMYLCPASYHYGCCYSGMACGPNACYSTVPATYTVSSKVVITSDGHTSTSYSYATTVMTPTIPAGLPTNDPNYAAKFIPTAIAKVTPTSTDNGGSSGLSTAQIGGIVGGAIAVLLVVLTAAFLIIRHLNRVVDAVESRKDASSGAQTKSAAHAPHTAYNHDKLHPSPSEVDAMSYDPLILSNPSSGSTPQAVSSNLRNRSDSESMASTPYNPSSATADLAAIRHTSLESSAGYFDLPPRVSNVPGRHPGSFNATGSHRVSTDSQGTQFSSAYPAYAYQQHGRQYSNASEAGSSDAGGVGSPLIPAELDPTGVVGELPTSHDPSGGRSRASSVTSPQTSMQGRRRSDPPVSAATARNETLVGLGFQQPLDVVNEGAEVIHGYYGPRDQAVGQTAAGLDITHDVSSPVHVNVATQWEGGQPQTNMPPITMPPNELPPDSYPPNTYQPNEYPPNAYPPNTYPPNTYPPNTYPPNTYPPNNFPPNNP